MASPMTLTRTEKRFLQCHKVVSTAEAFGDKVGLNIARAELQQCYDMIGEERAQELLG